MAECHNRLTSLLGSTSVNLSSKVGVGASRTEQSDAAVAEILIVGQIFLSFKYNYQYLRFLSLFFLKTIKH